MENVNNKVCKEERKDINSIITGLKEELSEGKMLNLESFLCNIKEDEKVVKELNDLYYEEEGVEFDFVDTVHKAFRLNDHLMFAALLDFINSAGDTHDRLEEILKVSEPSVYYCNHCGGKVDVSKDYFSRHFVFCHECASEECYECGEQLPPVVHNGITTSCHVCGNLFCKECLISSKSQTNGNYNICSSCIAELGDISPEELVEVAKHFVMTVEEAYKYFKEYDLRIFNSAEDYIDWMYDSNASKANLFDQYINETINTKSETLAEFIVNSDLSRIKKLEGGRIVFFFN